MSLPDALTLVLGISRICKETLTSVILIVNTKRDIIRLDLKQDELFREASCANDMRCITPLWFAHLCVLCGLQHVTIM